MTPLIPARRSAERFDRLVEGGRRDDAAGAVDPATAELLELVGALRAVPQPEARPEFVADLRAQLMAAAETELVPAPGRSRDEVERLTITPRRDRRQRRLGVAVGAVALLGATTSVAVASQGAIPGDTLYPLKRAIENTHTGISVGDDAKGQTMLANARDRLDEVGRLSRKSDPDTALVTETLDAFTEQAGQAGDHLIKDYQQHGDEGSIKQLDQFTHQSVDTLADLDGAIPSGAHDALLAAAAKVLSLDAIASNLCPSCGEPITEVPAHLVAGAATAVDDATEALTEAGEQLTGTGTTQPSPSQDGTPSGDGGKHAPSGLNPPADPVQLPTSLPTAIPTDGTDGTGGTGGGLGDVLPTTTGGDHGGNATDGGGGGKGGKGKGGKGVAVDLAPVSDTVNEVVTGVVESVNGLLSALTGGAGGSGAGTGLGQ